MNIHKNACLTPQGRLLMVQRIETEGWRVADAAAAAGLSVRRAFEWLRRYRAGGAGALQDRHSTPARYRVRQPSARPPDRGVAPAALDRRADCPPARPRPAQGPR